MEEKNRLSVGRIKIDRTLAELCAGILLWGMLCQLAGVLPLKDRSGYSIGLWYGVLLGILSAVHMWWGLNRALDFSQDAAVKKMTGYNILRYLLIVFAMGVIMIVGFGSPLSAFLGLMGLKAAAYIQPLTHKLLARFLKEAKEKDKKVLFPEE